MERIEFSQKMEEVAFLGTYSKKLSGTNQGDDRDIKNCGHSSLLQYFNLNDFKMKNNKIKLKKLVSSNYKNYR